MLSKIGWFLVQMWNKVCVFSTSITKVSYRQSRYQQYCPTLIKKCSLTKCITWWYRLSLKLISSQLFSFAIFSQAPGGKSIHKRKCKKCSQCNCNETFQPLIQSYFSLWQPNSLTMIWIDFLQIFALEVGDLGSNPQPMKTFKFIFLNNCTAVLIESFSHFLPSFIWMPSNTRWCTLL